jgi:hypothetical protein
MQDGDWKENDSRVGRDAKCSGLDLNMLITVSFRSTFRETILSFATSSPDFVHYAAAAREPSRVKGRLE